MTIEQVDVTEPEYRCLFATDIEGWSARPGIDQACMQRATSAIVQRALGRHGLSDPSIHAQTRGDGVLLSLPGSTPKPRLTEMVARTLAQELDDHNLEAPRAHRMRWRVALHAGDVALADDGGLSGAAVVDLCRLVDSDVARRVLHGTAGSPLVAVLSDAWYRSVVGEGYASASGYSHVRVSSKDGVRPAWIRVPGQPSPPGLTAGDLWDGEPDGGGRSGPQGRAPDGGGSGVTATSERGTAIAVGTLHGDLALGNVTRLGGPS
jgi:hypothetical protein